MIKILLIVLVVTMLVGLAQVSLTAHYTCIPEMGMCEYAYHALGRSSLVCHRLVGGWVGILPLPMCAYGYIPYIYWKGTKEAL
jgi:hypothetical protein